MRFQSIILFVVFFALTAGADELPVFWQRFLPSSPKEPVPASETLTVATVSFDANEPVNGKALSAEDRAATNMLKVAEIVRQVKSACAKKDGVYAASKLLVCFPEDTFIGINEIDDKGRRSWRDFRDGVFGMSSIRSDSEWDRYYGKVPFPGDRVTLGLRDIAVKEDVYLSCSYETQDAGGEYRNVCTLFGPEKSQFGAEYGVIGYYYKVHPVAGEKYEIKRGDEFRVWSTKIGRIGMMICYDIMFPESARAYGVQGADLVIAATAWTRSYPDAFPGGMTWKLGETVYSADGPGMSTDGKDDLARSYVEMALRVAAAQNGYYIAVSSLANPGGMAYTAVIYPSGRVFCDTGREYRPGIAIANIGIPSRAHLISEKEIIGFNPFADRNPKAYKPLSR